MDIAILLYDRLTALDAVGPYDVLARLPGATVRWVATEPGAYRTEAGLSMVADHRLDEFPAPEIIVVPGGLGTRDAMRDQRILDWVGRAHETSRWTTSVCTGSFILGAAGLLDGIEATTHWAQLEHLRAFGAEPSKERVVRAGKILTAGGVSSGIDMALTLVGLEAGEDMARAIQLGIEYDPQPPFDAGSPEKAPPEIVALVRDALARGGNAPV